MTFVWYSTGSKDTGEFIAKLIGAKQHGTLPPKEYSGPVICYGATPADKFKWDERAFSSIFNDPRMVRNYINRKKMFARLSEGGLLVPTVVDIEEKDTYATLCAKLELNGGSTITVFSENGGNIAQANNSYQYEQIKGKTKLATGLDFGMLERTRIFVVNGAVIGGLRRSKSNTGAFIEKAAAEQTAIEDKGKAAELIKQLLGGGYVSQSKYFWTGHEAYSPAVADTAAKAAGLLQFDLCAVDVAETIAGGVKILNVVSTPDLVSYPSLHTALTNALKAWLNKKVRSSKDILKELTEKTDEAEADAIVEILRKFKAGKQ